MILHRRGLPQRIHARRRARDTVGVEGRRRRSVQCAHACQGCQRVRPDRGPVAGSSEPAARCRPRAAHRDRRRRRSVELARGRDRADDGHAGRGRALRPGLDGLGRPRMEGARRQPQRRGGHGVRPDLRRRDPRLARRPAGRRPDSHVRRDSRGRLPVRLRRGGRRHHGLARTLRFRGNARLPAGPRRAPDPDGSGPGPGDRRDRQARLVGGGPQAAAQRRSGGRAAAPAEGRSPATPAPPSPRDRPWPKPQPQRQ